MDPNSRWGALPVETEGDDQLYTTYGAVGAALTQWELFEAYLSLVFGVLIGLDRESMAAHRAYGSVLSFNGRLSMVKAAAEAYFLEHPHAELQAAFDRLSKEASAASQRRNEIAHGVVQASNPPKNVFDGARFVLYPAYYATTKRSHDHAPRYGYASKQINRFNVQFSELRDEAERLLMELHGRHAQL
jgi:hypothetical protein